MRIIYLINSFLIMLVGGTVYSYSIFRKPLEEYLNITSIQSGFPFKVFLILFAFSMPLSGYLIERIGVRKTYVLGSLLITSSWVSSYFINSIICFVLTYGVLGGIGTGILYGVPLKIVSLWFSDKKGIATGITVAGFGLSSFIASQIFKFLILNYPLNTSFFYFGLIVFLMLFICYFNVKVPKQISDYNFSKVGMDTFEVLKMKEFYILYLFFLFGCSFSLTSVSFTATYFIDFLNLDLKKASYVVSSMAVLNALGRPFFGYMADKFSFSFCVIFSFLMYFISSLLLLLNINFYFNLIAFAFLWFNLGGWLAMAPVSTMRFFGLLHYAKNYGVMYTAYGVGAFVGMSIVNLGYKMFFYYVLIVSLIIILFVVLKSKRINYNY
ncbi:MAG: OFA family MFS transporter [Elusimicrobiales bacterium]|nr:OFA family MFS transporter [Elusimicrobiales bacterium]